MITTIIKKKQKKIQFYKHITYSVKFHPPSAYKVCNVYQKFDILFSFNLISLTF